MDKITPEQEDILRHHPASPAAERIREERSKAAWAEREAEEQAKRAAAQDYIERMEAGLRLLGVDPSGDIKRQTDDITNRQMSDSDAAEHDLACALSERDGARVIINGILTKLGVSPVEGPEMRAKGIAQVCDEAHALRLIAEHLGLSKLDPDAVRRRVQSDAVDLKVARERVAKVESLLSEECARGDNARRALSILGIIGDDPIGQAKLRAQIDAERNENSARRAKELEAARSATRTYASAEITANTRAVKAELRINELERIIRSERAHSRTQAEEINDLYVERDGLRDVIKRGDDAAKELDKILEAGPIILKLDQDSVNKLKEMLSNPSSAGMVVTPNADPTHSYNAEIVAARIDALKTLGVNPYDPPVCIHGAAKKKAKTLEHAQKFEDELAQIWELWGAGRPQTPGCVLDAAQEHERLNTALHTKLGAIAEKLNDARVPTHYGLIQDGSPVPLPERVDLLINAHATARALVESWETTANREIGERMDASAVLDDLGAPDHAGPVLLTTAARILALPGLLRKD